jgi:hypothetical protein
MSPLIAQLPTCRCSARKAEKGQEETLLLGGGSDSEL